MGKNKVTSSDVAKAAGVSQATVSMVLNKKYNVSFSKETVEKVEQAATKLGYKVPRRRIRKDSKGGKLIVVFCPTLTNPYYVMLLQGIEEVAKENGYGVFVCDTQRDMKLEDQYLKMMKSMQPMGIIYTSSPSFCRQVDELSASIPIVIIGNRDETMSVDTVELNNTKPGRLMARHLLELGHRKVAFVTTPLLKRLPARIKRVDGFVSEFEGMGPGYHVIIKSPGERWNEQMPSIDSEYRMGYDMTKELIRDEKGITAIVGLDDMIAVGIMDALLEAKYKIPADISVMGCDNTLISSLQGVSLTTLEHFVVLKGRDACDIVVKKIASLNTYNSEIQSTSIYHVEYEPKLIIRGSTSYAKIHF